ncbi:MAG TPA: hypothetical protein VK796_01205, partial [Cytophaga sp.]|nr:hypothetical protein [Cytophaga sp.]
MNAVCYTDLVWTGLLLLFIGIRILKLWHFRKHEAWYYSVYNFGMSCCGMTIAIILMKWDKHFLLEPNMFRLHGIFFYSGILCTVFAAVFFCWTCSTIAMQRTIIQSSY